MTVSQLEGFVAGVLGHSNYKVLLEEEDKHFYVQLSTFKDARKMCNALIKQTVDFMVIFQKTTEVTYIRIM
jgi:hypothetical protein